MLFPAKIVDIFSYFSMKTYNEGTHREPQQLIPTKYIFMDINGKFIHHPVSAEFSIMSISQARVLL